MLWSSGFAMAEVQWKVDGSFGERHDELCGKERKGCIKGLAILSF